MNEEHSDFPTDGGSTQHCGGSTVQTADQELGLALEDAHYIIEKAGAVPSGFEELLRESDIVTLHLPFTPEVRHLMNAETLALMKDGAYLVNTARGGLVDEAALCEALASGKLAGAAIDVYETEPITADNPLFKFENAVFSPHVSALSFETNYNGSLICAESIINVYNGGKPVYPVR